MDKTPRRDKSRSSLDHLHLSTQKGSSADLDGQTANDKAPPEIALAHSRQPTLTERDSQAAVTPRRATGREGNQALETKHSSPQFRSVASSKGSPKDASANSASPSSTSKKSPVASGEMAALADANSSSSSPTLSLGRDVPPLVFASSHSSSGAHADDGLNNCVAPDSPAKNKEAERKEVKTRAAPLAHDYAVFEDLPESAVSIVNAGIQRGALLKPEALGGLVVAVDSRGGKLKLADDRINRILRGGLSIRGFVPKSSNGKDKRDVNVLTEMVLPFMNQHLIFEGLETLRKGIWKDYVRLLKQQPKESRSDNGSKFDPMKEAVKPVIKPLIDFICGENFSLQSSRLPDQMKRLLLSIDKNVIKWFGKNGTGDHKDLYDARRSALIAFLSTRSIGFLWINRLQAENKTEDYGKINRLMQYVNSTIAKDIDIFLNEIIVNQPDQPERALVYAKVMAKAAQQRKDADADDLSNTDAPSWGAMLSPRDLSNRGDGIVRARKKEDVREGLERAKYGDDLATATGLDRLDPAFKAYLKSRFNTMSRRGFDNVRMDPVAYVLRYHGKFYSLPENEPKVQSGLSTTVIKAIEGLNAKEHPHLFVSRSDDDSASE